MDDNNLQTTYQQLWDKVILNVDDNDMNHLVISKLLATVGMKLITATDGATAINKLREGLKPDVILMDLQMPVMDGIETTKIIRTQIDHLLPIIISSGNVEPAERWKLERLGVKDFLEKPYTVKDILSKISKNIMAHA